MGNIILIFETKQKMDSLTISVTNTEKQPANKSRRADCYFLISSNNNTKPTAITEVVIIAYVFVIVGIVHLFNANWLIIKPAFIIGHYDANGIKNMHHTHQIGCGHANWPKAFTIGDRDEPFGFFNMGIEEFNPVRYQLKHGITTHTNNP